MSKKTVLMGIDASLLSREVKQKLFEAREREKCARKHKYLSESAALMRANYYDNEGKRTKHSRKKSHAYQCHWCSYWHLTTNGRK